MQCSWLIDKGDYCLLTPPEKLYYELPEIKMETDAFIAMYKNKELHGKTIIADYSRVTEIISDSIAVFFIPYTMFSRNQIRYAVIGINKAIEKTIRHIKCLNDVPVFNNLVEALQYFGLEKEK